jgi:hypothetical protein
LELFPKPGHKYIQQNQGTYIGGKEKKDRKEKVSTSVENAENYFPLVLSSENINASVRKGSWSSKKSQ